MMTHGIYRMLRSGGKCPCEPHHCTSRGKNCLAGLSQESLRDQGVPEGLWGWRGAWQGHSLQEFLEVGSFVVLGIVLWEHVVKQSWKNPSGSFHKRISGAFEAQPQQGTMR